MRPASPCSSRSQLPGRAHSITDARCPLLHLTRQVWTGRMREVNASPPSLVETRSKQKQIRCECESTWRAVSDLRVSPTCFVCPHKFWSTQWGVRLWMFYDIGGLWDLNEAGSNQSTASLKVKIVIFAQINVSVLPWGWSDLGGVWGGQVVPHISISWQVMLTREKQFMLFFFFALFLLYFHAFFLSSHFRYNLTPYIKLYLCASTMKSILNKSKSTFSNLTLFFFFISQSAECFKFIKHRTEATPGPRQYIQQGFLFLCNI